MTPDQRISIAVELLGAIQLDIYSGRYGRMGRPNITSVLHLLTEPDDVLEAFRADLGKMLLRLRDEQPRIPPP